VKEKKQKTDWPSEELQEPAGRVQMLASTKTLFLILEHGIDHSR
jgi:hypothetical protein